MDWTTTESTRQLAKMFDKKHPDAVELAIQYLESHTINLENIDNYIPAKDMGSFIGDEYQDVVDLFKSKYFMIHDKMLGIGTFTGIFVDHINRRLIPVHIEHIREMCTAVIFKNNVLIFNWRYYFWQLFYENELCTSSTDYLRKCMDGKPSDKVKHKLKEENYEIKFYLTNNTIIKI